MSKAYDIVDWQFLLSVLSKMGFHDKLIHWIISCVTIVSYSVSMNGKIIGIVKPNRVSYREIYSLPIYLS